ncbi:hypothetical protein HOLleu_24174 [Holothuria leucospilota]|uniref:NACHT domain-containing protein n=1 Tax=Holothuria leucospilota TaxID=206669 RepID=A0A9Q1BVV7_HOLLE|nr:hypothetical protein HOLleu_24174 [Holothuria leucospilota]
MGNAAQYQTVPKEEDEIPSKLALPLTKGTESSAGNPPELIEAKKQLFIQELKQKYKLLCGASHSIAFVRDRLRCTHKVFVQGGIEILSTSWLPLQSHNDVLWDPKVKSKRRLVLGEIGSGRSTLASQFVYDWCNSVSESFLKNVEILIFLKMRQITGVHSIQKIIKQYLLPRNSDLNESDIDTVLRSCFSVVFILDGLDEYPDVGNKSDIWKIITAQLFPDFDVILTSNHLAEKYQVNMTRLRLTGFEDKAHFEYIRKAVAGDDAMAAEMIKQKLTENPVLEDLCQLPFFFVMFAHISHNNGDFGTLNTVTSFFKYMIECFHNHMGNKTKLFDLKESSHSALEKFAFDCINKQNLQTCWRKADLCRRLGDECYHHYLQIGILVEEEACNARGQTDVTFYHKLFYEWYAAQHFAKCASEWKYEKLNKELQHVHPSNHQYFYRFACGLNHFTAGKIIDYLREKEASDKLAALCILEQGEQVASILDTVRDLCSKEITLEKEPNKLLQRSIVRVLEIASSNEVIPILCVRLYDCYSTVDLSLWSIQLKLHTTIPVLATLKKLWIRETDRKIGANELEGILHYCSRCLRLEKVWFWGCLLPQSVQADSLSALRSRNVEVLWRIDNNTANQKLDLESGSWNVGDDGKLMTDDDYEKLVQRKEWVTE